MEIFKIIKSRIVPIKDLKSIKLPSMFAGEEIDSQIDNGEIWYNSTENVIKGKVAGTVVEMSSSRTPAYSLQEVTESTDLTIANKLVFVDATAGDVTLNLPTAIGLSGVEFNIKKIDASINTVTIDAFETQTIDDELTQVLDLQYESITIVSNGANWFII